MKKYKDITKLYNIRSFENDYVLINYNGIDTKIFMYKIEPIVILGLSESEINNILTVYKEFLRQVNFDFQIIMLNNKLNVDNYIESLVSRINITTNFNSELKSDYLKDIKKKLEKENIYETEYYIIVSLAYNSSYTVDFVDNVIKKLNKIGCEIYKVCGDKNLKKLIHKCIKK